MCSGCHRETTTGYESAKKSEDCDDCHGDAPGLVFFLGGAEEILLRLTGEEPSRLTNTLAEMLLEEELTVVTAGSPRITADCSVQTEELFDPVLIPASSGLRLFRGDASVRLRLGPNSVHETRFRSRVHVTADPGAARSRIRDWLAVEAFRFICGRLEDE